MPVSRENLDFKLETRPAHNQGNIQWHRLLVCAKILHKKLTTLIDLNYLQGSQAPLIISQIKYQDHKDQTAGIQGRLSYIAACLLIVPVYRLFCRRSFHIDHAGYRKLSK